MLSVIMNLEDSDGATPAAKKRAVETGGSAEAASKAAAEKKVSIICAYQVGKLKC
jgi:hypothetical protein